MDNFNSGGLEKKKKSYKLKFFSKTNFCILISKELLMESKGMLVEGKH